MVIFWEKSEDKKYKIYKLKNPIAWNAAFAISFLLVFTGIYLKQGYLIFVGLILLAITVIVGGIEGGLLTNDAKIAKLKGKEVIIKGKTFSIKNPTERWIEK